MARGVPEAGGERRAVARGDGESGDAAESESGRGGYMPFLAEAALPDKRDDAPPQAA